MDCVKKSFQNKEESVTRIAEINSKNGKEKKPIRSYRCQNCGCFHLTSWSNRFKKSIKRKKINQTKNRISASAEYWIKKKRWSN